MPRIHSRKENEGIVANIQSDLSGGCDSNRRPGVGVVGRCRGAMMEIECECDCDCGYLKVRMLTVAIRVQTKTKGEIPTATAGGKEQSESEIKR